MSPPKVRLSREARNLLLVAPALVFLLAAFVLPVVLFFWRAIDNSEISDSLPNTVAAMDGWDAAGSPPPEIYDAMIEDLRNLEGTTKLAVLARRLNYHEAGLRPLILGTASGLSEAKPDAGTMSSAERLTAIDARWSDRDIWVLLKQQSGALTPYFMLSAVDLVVSPDGTIENMPPERAIYRPVLARTFIVSFAITLACLVIGYPVAYFMATVPGRVSRIAIAVVVISMWTSLLVRTLAWIIIFQKGGVLASSLTMLGLVDGSPSFMRSWLAVSTSMIHIMLPLVILPLYSVMRNIPPSYVKAAKSLGAHPFKAFITVYIPQTMPGVGVGAILVSTLALGFFVTPELLGGPQQQMISYFISFFVNKSVNWSLASAFGVWLIALTIFFLGAYAMLFRVKRQMGGGSR